MRWARTWRADPRLARLADRHYARQTPGHPQFAPPGRFIGLITRDGRAGWVSSWPEYATHGLGDAWICTLFRNEDKHLYLSSEMITEAIAATRAEWGDPPPGGTLTFVDERKVRRKRHPGYCFLCAGFKRLSQRTRERDLIILHLPVADHPPAAPPANTQLALEVVA